MARKWAYFSRACTLRTVPRTAYPCSSSSRTQRSKWGRWLRRLRGGESTGRDGRALDYLQPLGGRSLELRQQLRNGRRFAARCGLLHRPADTPLRHPKNSGRLVEGEAAAAHKQTR
jgi:hypothetical protein